MNCWIYLTFSDKILYRVEFELISSDNFWCTNVSANYVLTQQLFLFICTWNFNSFLKRTTLHSQGTGYSKDISCCIFFFLSCDRCAVFMGISSDKQTDTVVRRISETYTRMNACTLRGTAMKFMQVQVFLHKCHLRLITCNVFNAQGQTGNWMIRCDSTDITTKSPLMFEICEGNNID